MRKILSVTFTLILCLTLIAPVCGEEDRADGYFWEQLGERNKGFFMLGFVAGHDTGFFNGLIHANKREDLKGEDLKLKAAELAYNILQYRRAEEDRTSSWYIREVDAFLQTYPLCKKQDLKLTLDSLTWIWFKMPNAKQLTYKEVGEGCSK